MKKIVKVIEKQSHYVDVVFRYDEGMDMTATLTKNQYHAQVAKEKIFEFLSVTNISKTELKNIMKQIENLEDIKYIEGYEEGTGDCSN